MAKCSCEVHPVRDEDGTLAWGISYCPVHKAADALLEALIWASGASDFQEGGEARQGYLHLVRPAIDAALGSERFTPQQQ